MLAPGYADLEFEPPPAGSYRLPPLGEAVDGEVLASDGRSLRLHDLMGQGPLLLSFIYTSCSDVNGCPLATHVLSKTSSKLKADASIADRLRMVSLSFDPEHDTPAVMRRYSAPFSSVGITRLSSVMPFAAFGTSFVVKGFTRPLESITNKGYASAP